MNRQHLISTLCGSSTDDNYLSCQGHLKDKCTHDKYCDLCHLSDKQVEYILSDIQADVYLNACPGSGKTEVVGIKCAYEMLTWNNPTAGIAILTFTNSAENELVERVSSYYRRQPNYPHFLGTFTSWLHGYIANPFLYIETGHGNDNDNSIKIIDPDCSSDFINAFRTKYSYGNTLRKIAANEYFFNAKDNCYQYCGKLRNGEQEFHSMLTSLSYMEKDIKETKRRLWKSGFFLYEDIEILAYSLLCKNPEITSLISKRFPVVIVDECQDLSYIQLLILELLREYGTKLHFIGDLDQSIYAFRNIDPCDTVDFLKKHTFHEIILDENYRSNQSIVDISGLLINRTTPVKGMRAHSTALPLLVLLYRKDQEPMVIQKYAKLLSDNNIESKNCRIIVRNNSLRSRLYGNKLLDTKGTPNVIEDYAHAIFLQGSNNITDFQEGLQFLARAIQKSFFSEYNHENKLKLYCPKDISEADWRNLLLDVQRSLLGNQEITNLQQTWDKWKNSLKKQLSQINSPLLKEKELKNFRLKSGVKENIVYDAFFKSSANTKDCTINIETIHSCKGLSLDSVLFMSSYQRGNHEDSGNYWKEWFPEFTGGIISEANRLAYVAASRAKHMLVFGIPNPTSSPISKKEQDYLESCGFKILNCEI